MIYLKEYTVKLCLKKIQMIGAILGLMACEVTKTRKFLIC